MQKKMDWCLLLTKDKIFPPSIRINDDNDRSEFERDHNKIVFSPSFRNLQNKTQLFPIPQSHFIHSRLTHSLEVASVGKSMGNLVAKYIIKNNLETNIPNSFRFDVPEIIGAACLLHDIGNPPFGHAGEDAISSFYQEQSTHLEKYLGVNLLQQLSNFDGNAQTIRIIYNSHDLNLTLATVAAVMKYPTTYNPKSIYKHKHSVFEPEVKLLNQVAHNCGLIKLDNNEYCRHPLSFLVEAADDICYRLLDLEDAYKLRLISYADAEGLLTQIIHSRHQDLNQVFESLKGLSANDKFSRLRSYALNILIGEIVGKFIYFYPEIMTGEYNKLIINNKLCSLTDMLLLEDTELSHSLLVIGKYVKEHAYTYSPVLEIELSGYEILDFLLAQFVGAVIETNSNLSTNSLPKANLNFDKILDYRGFGRNTRRFSKNEKLIKLLPTYSQLTNKSISQQIMVVTDYISGMADIYALELYRKLKGIELPELA